MNESVIKDIAVLQTEFEHIRESIDKQTRAQEKANKAHEKTNKALESIAISMDKRLTRLEDNFTESQKKINTLQSEVKEAGNNINDVQKRHAVLKYQVPLWGVGGGVLSVTAYKTFPPFIISLLKMVGL